MAEYNFKNLSDVDALDDIPDSATFIGISDQTVFKSPVANLVNSPMVIDLSDADSKKEDTAYGNTVKNAILKGIPVWLYSVESDSKGNSAAMYYPVVVFTVRKTSRDKYYLILGYLDPNGEDMFKMISLVITA